MNIAIIPARGGSKRIPGKNVKSFAQKPMIAYAISVAKLSGLFEHIVVSTDNEETAVIAQEWGAETPFFRPVDLANDYTATAPVIAHAINECCASGWVIDHVCCIYPGVPLLQTEDLQGALTLLIESDADFSFPVTEFTSPVQRAMKRDIKGKMHPFYPQFELTRTQDLAPAYHDAGQFYWGSQASWLRQLNIHSSGVGYVIPNWRVVDIDTHEDWIRAEAMFLSLNR